ncbi:MAG: HD domain-containing protein [Spirochaetales bacterium]|nr:HD domain-containing protein [Spirochaetales bacterium]
MNIIERIRKEAKAILKDFRSSHDWDHTERVYRLALQIGEKERANLLVIALAALLHDIGRSCEDRSNGKICHAKRGAEMAGTLLQKYDLEKKIIDQVIHCIETHRYRNNKQPESLEARVLFDADKLDSIGAVGIGRAFLFAGEVGAKLHNKGNHIMNTKPYTEEDTAYREYMVKLRHIKERILTDEGKRIARERHEFMEEFFMRLESEMEGIL